MALTLIPLIPENFSCLIFPCVWWLARCIIPNMADFRAGEIHDFGWLNPPSLDAKVPLSQSLESKKPPISAELLGFPRWIQHFPRSPYFSGWKVDIFPGRSLATPLRRLGQGPPGPFRAAGAQDVAAVGTGWNHRDVGRKNGWCIFFVGWKRKWLETNMSTSGEIGSFCWFFVRSWLDCEILMVFPSHNFEAPVQSIYWWLSSTHVDLASFLFGLYAGLIVGYWWWVFPLTKRACYHWCG